MVDAHLRRQFADAIFTGFVRYDVEPRDTFRQHLRRHLPDGEPAIESLPAGHRDCVVE